VRKLWLIPIVASLGCGSSSPDAAPSSGIAARFDLAADLGNPSQFFDFPYPSDLRIDAAGHPDLSGFPNPDDNLLVGTILPIAREHPAFPVVPVAYFRFEGPLEQHDPTAVIAAATTSPVLLIDVDPSSPDRGKLWPTVAATPEPDGYVPENLLAVAARPGFVLHPNRTYAFALRDGIATADARVVVAADDFAALRDGTSENSAATELYAPLWEALDEAGVARASVVAATVFTTGDVVAALANLSDAVRDEHDVVLEDLAVDDDDGAAHERFCELHGIVRFPQFQRGEPPFNSEGLFEFGEDQLPIVQREETAPMVIALPKQIMPPGGFPLVMYFHGSGGMSDQVIDRGTVLVPDGTPTKGEGPAHVLAAHGFASVGCAHPVNPERLPGASDTAYLNFDNLAAFRDTFRQGVIEQRLYLDALLELEITPELVSDCEGLALPTGETAFRFSPAPIMAMGQSMGGMYTNTIGAVEPRIQAVVPTGAGGFWSYFILETSLVGGKTLVPILLQSSKNLSFMHPALHLLETAWQPTEPMVYMPRLGLRPLDDHPVRPVYEPVGKGDSYFPTVLFDAMALAYGHQQAGDEIWPTMQQALTLAELDGILDYPVSANLTSERGNDFTGVVVQYEGDGIYDPHSIFAQLDAVKHQYGCFFETFLNTGEATVPAPAPLGSPCSR